MCSFADAFVGARHASVDPVLRAPYTASLPMLRRRRTGVLSSAWRVSPPPAAFPAVMISARTIPVRKGVKVAVGVQSLARREARIAAAVDEDSCGTSGSRFESEDVGDCYFEQIGRRSRPALAVCACSRLRVLRRVTQSAPRVPRCGAAYGDHDDPARPRINDGCGSTQPSRCNRRSCSAGAILSGLRRRRRPRPRVDNTAASSLRPHHGIARSICASASACMLHGGGHCRPPRFPLAMRDHGIGFVETKVGAATSRGPRGRWVLARRRTSVQSSCATCDTGDGIPPASTA